MPRWLTLPAASAAALLAFAAYSAPLGALELNYQAPDPSVAPAPKPPTSPGPAPKAEKPPITWAEARDKKRFSRRHRVRSSGLQQAAHQTLSRV